MAAQPAHDDRRKLNVKFIVIGALVALLVVFALLNTHDVGVDFIFNTWSAPMIVVIAIPAALGFVIGFLVRGHYANRSND
jgi:uncharacterized integral membrane protein